MNNYVVATIKDWHINRFKEVYSKDQSWTLIDNPEFLTFKNLSKIKPRYVFFPHWSWIVPAEIYHNFECVCFHSSDVPYGRGGSPIQNLISHGHKSTKISALRMVKELDAGPVYLKRSLSLEGKAQEIYENSAEIIFEMMSHIVKTEPVPVEQEGDVITFKRRQNMDNLLPKEGSLETVYDHIRMLDAQTYPNSYIEYGDFKLEFQDAVLEKDKLEAKVTITRRSS